MSLKQTVNDYSPVIIMAFLIAVVTPFYLMELNDYCDGSFFDRDDKCNPTDSPKITFMVTIMVIISLLMIVMISVCSNGVMLQKILDKSKTDK